MGRMAVFTGSMEPCVSLLTGGTGCDSGRGAVVGGFLVEESVTHS